MKRNKDRELNKKHFVVYWNNIPAPYMVERFNFLADRSNLNFEAWFNDRKETDRSWIVDESTWRFQYCYSKKFSLGRMVFHLPISLFKIKKPDLLVSLYAEPSYVFGWIISKFRNVKNGFWVETTFNSWVQRNVFKERIKKFIFSYVDFIITVGKDGRDYALRYGVPLERIFFAPHRINVKYYSEKRSLLNSERMKLRAEIGLFSTTFLYVGRILKIKGLTHLFDAFKELQRISDTEVSLLLVGDGADTEFYKKKSKSENLRNVIFTGFIQKKDLPKMYSVADVFVFPSLGDPYGIVLDEAMACSLPIITTESIGELHKRLIDGKNCFIVPPENSYALAEAMLKLLNNSELRRKMGSVSRSYVEGHSPEIWAIDFERIVFSVLDER